MIRYYNMYIRMYINPLNIVGTTDQLIQCIKEVMERKHASLSKLFEDSLKSVANEMLQAGLITQALAREPSFDAINGSFLNAMDFMEEFEEIEQHCTKFISVFFKLGGPFLAAGRAIKKNIVEAAGKLGVDIKIIL